MSLPRYAEYKDSGVAWLGEVPSHWSVTTVKRLTSRISSGKTPLGGSETYVDEGVLFLRSQNVYDEGLRLDDVVFISEDVDETMAVSRVRPGDILLNITGASIGRSCQVPAEFPPANVNQHVCAVRLADAVQVPFVGWLFRSEPIKNQIDFAQNGAAREGLNFDQIGRMALPIAPLLEQEAVVAFLDRETGKIDMLIAEQEKLLILLAEKRQATISHAVTRGLTNLPGADLNAAFGGGPKGEGKDSPSNPNAPMKDSGVPWLGEVPAHWEVTRLKFVASVQSGIAKGKDNQGKETITVPYLRVANVQDGHLALEQVTMIDIEPEQLNRYRLQVGDVLMNEGGDFDKLGRGAIWNGEIDDCIHQNHVFAVRPHAVSPRWLNQIAGSRYAQFYFMGRSKQSTNLASISSTNIMELPVLLPPVEEQVAILAFLDDENTRLDALYDSSTLAISLLKERRSALIAAAVTGKIDVRNTSQTTEDASA